MIADLSLPIPTLTTIRIAIGAVWLYEGLWCKLLGREPSQEQIVASVPRLGERFGHAFLKILGAVEVGLGAWVIWGVTPGWCALAQAVLLAVLNANGILWARGLIRDPLGMVLKNIAFLVLVWVCAAMPLASGMGF